MANAIDKLVISLGFDSVELNEGLRKASGAIADFGKRVELDGRALDRLAATASKTGLMMGGVSDEVAERVMSIGTAGQKTSLVMGRAMDGISARVGKVGALLKTALGPVLAVFAGGKIFSGHLADGREPRRAERAHGRRRGQNRRMGQGEPGRRWL